MATSPPLTPNLKPKPQGWSRLAESHPHRPRATADSQLDTHGRADLLWRRMNHWQTSCFKDHGGVSQSGSELHSTSHVYRVNKQLLWTQTLPLIPARTPANLVKVGHACKHWEYILNLLLLVWKHNHVLTPVVTVVVLKIHWHMLYWCIQKPLLSTQYYPGPACYRSHALIFQYSVSQDELKHAGNREVTVKVLRQILWLETNSKSVSTSACVQTNIQCLRTYIEYV